MNVIGKRDMVTFTIASSKLDPSKYLKALFNCILSNEELLSKRTLKTKRCVHYDEKQ